MKTAGSFVSRISLVGAAALACALLLGGRAAAQQTPGKPATVPPKGAERAPLTPGPHVVAGAPEELVYRMFFSHVVSMEGVAQKLESEGKSGYDVRAHDRREAGLNEDEDTIVKQVATDGNNAVLEVEAKAKAEVLANRANHQVQLSGAVMQEANEHKKSIIDAHVAQLQSMLGESSFAKLDSYVKRLIEPSPMKPATRRKAQ